MRSELEVDGFLFSNMEDAELALKEKKQVEYLKTHMDLSASKNMLMVYEKANKEHLFRTPIGISYLQELRNQLLKAGVGEENLSSICLYANFEPRLRTRTEPARQRSVQSKKEELKKKFHISILLNVLLAAAVIAMFWMAVKSNQPNILNYEKALQNRYAAWEQELTERENVIREKERNTP